MVYIVEYTNDWNERHICSLCSFEEVKNLRKNYQNVTILTSKKISNNLIKFYNYNYTK